MVLLRYESNYINLFKPDTRVVRDYHTVESRLGGIGLVELVVPAGTTLDRGALERFRKVERSIAAAREPGAATAAHVQSLATVLDPDGRLAALPDEVCARR